MQEAIVIVLAIVSAGYLLWKFTAKKSKSCAACDHAPKEHKSA